MAALPLLIPFGNQKPERNAEMLANLIRQNSLPVTRLAAQLATRSGNSPFGMSWDDNWGRWNWCGDAKISGCEDLNEAARRILGALFENWGYDLKDDENKPFREFLENL